jgi:hypothetical protein
MEECWQEDNERVIRARAERGADHGRPEAVPLGYPRARSGVPRSAPALASATGYPRARGAGFETLLKD